MTGGSWARRNGFGAGLSLCDSGGLIEKRGITTIASSASATSAFLSLRTTMTVLITDT